MGINARRFIYCAVISIAAITAQSAFAIVDNCGDGQPDAGEQCDDGNTTGGDGCSSSCQVETEFVCTLAIAGTPPTPSICEESNPDIDIEKATNGVDADDPNAGNAPIIAPGALVTWTYIATNTGNVNLTNVMVTDDQGVAVSCPKDTLNVDESMTCTGSGVAEDLTTTGFTTVTGLCGGYPSKPLYKNIGTATGTFADKTVEDSDPSHYCNPVPVIGVAKTAVVDGAQVTLDFYLENFGNVVLSNLALPDDLDAVFGAGNYLVTGSPAFIVDPGTITLNGGFDGSGDTALITTGTLSVGSFAQIRIVVDVTALTDQGAGLGVYSNQVTASGEGPGPTPTSDLSTSGTDPDPNGNGDPNEDGENVPTEFTSLLDSDSDGVPDYIEGNDDRDDDDIPNALDYDPTGYFYNTANNEIIPGGQISVSCDVGTPDFVGGNDGFAGFYQYTVSTVGNPSTCTQTITLPAGYVLDNACPDLGSLDVPTGPAPLVLGAGENGNTGFLTTAACGNNPYHSVLLIESDDAVVLNNNIALRRAAGPSIAVPTLPSWTLALLMLLLGGVGVFVHRLRTRTS